MVTSLQKKTRQGQLYTRPAKIEALLGELELLSRADLVARCSIMDPSHPGYVPSECLLYFVRASRSDNQDSLFDGLFNALALRVQARLPKDEDAQGNIDLTKSRIIELGNDWFLEKLVLDRSQYCEKLDYFEIRFNSAMKAIRTNAERIAYREARRKIDLQNTETNEIMPEVEEAAGVVNPFDNEENMTSDYRSVLDAAIDSLTEEQIMTVQLLRKGTIMHSDDPNVLSITKIMGCAEKTVRNRRDKAFEIIRARLKGEE